MWVESIKLPLILTFAMISLKLQVVEKESRFAFTSVHIINVGAHIMEFQLSFAHSVLYIFPPYFFDALLMLFLL